MKNGFTLIELLIVVAVIGLALAIIEGATKYGTSDHKCIGGYKFTHGGTQIISGNGGGIPCDPPEIKTQGAR